MTLLNTFILVLTLIQTPAPAPKLRDQLNKKLLADVQALERDYHVKMIFDLADFPKQEKGSYQIQGLQATLQAIEAYLPMFIEEWRLYPPSLVIKTQLRYIVVGSDFVLPKENRVRYAIPDYFHDTMFYDVSLSRSGELYQMYLLEVIHHEFYHFVDYKDDGIVYGDDVWKKLNPKEFRYGRGGASVQGDSTQGTVTDRIPGFISRYATSGVEEDKAEVFRCMLVNLYELELRAEKDPVLQSKIKRMMVMMEDFCPEMNAAYWERLRSLPRPRLTREPYQDQWAKDHPTLPTRPTSVAVAMEVCECPSSDKRSLTLMRPCRVLHSKHSMKCGTVFGTPKAVLRHSKATHASTALGLPSTVPRSHYTTWHASLKLSRGLRGNSLLASP